MFRRFLEEPYKPDSLEVALEHLMTEVEHTEPTEGQINSDNQNWKFGSCCMFQETNCLFGYAGFDMADR